MRSGNTEPCRPSSTSHPQAAQPLCGRATLREEWARRYRASFNPETEAADQGRTSAGRSGEAVRMGTAATVLPPQISRPGGSRPGCRALQERLRFLCAFFSRPGYRNLVKPRSLLGTANTCSTFARAHDLKSHQDDHWGTELGSASGLADIDEGQQLASCCPGRSLQSAALQARNAAARRFRGEPSCRA